MGPVLLRDTAQTHSTQPMLQKLNELGYTVLLHPLYSPDLSSTNYNFFKHLNNFLQGKCFYNQQGAENAFRQFMKHEFLCYRNKQTYVSLTNVLIVMVPIFITKDVLDCRYNDLKFIVQNHSYFRTNLNNITRQVI